MTGATFILMQKSNPRPEQIREVIKFFDWAFSDEGDKLAASLDYVPMPTAVVQHIRTTLKAQVKSSKGASIL